MCIECWREYGSPQIINDKVLLASGLILQVHDFSLVGGNAHVVVDDWNLEDETLQWCLTGAIKQNVHEGTADQLTIERKCLAALLELPMEQRVSAMALAYSFFDREGNDA